MFKSLLIQILSFYQRYISPYKGYSCAYRVQHNALSCSAYAKQVLAMHDLSTARQLIYQRLQACHLTAQSVNQNAKQTADRRLLRSKNDNSGGACQVPAGCCEMSRVNNCDVTGVESIGSCSCS